MKAIQNKNNANKTKPSKKKKPARAVSANLIRADNEVMKVRSHMKAEMSVVAASFAMPHTEKAIRWPSEFSTAATAVANPYTIVQTGLPQIDQELPIDSVFCCVFRNPLRAAVVWNSNSGGASYTYDWYLTTATSSTAPRRFVGPTATAEYLPLQVAYSVNSAGPAAHGPILYSGTDESDPDGRYQWMDLFTVLTVAQTTAVAALTVQIFRWAPSQRPVQVAQLNIIGVGTDSYTAGGPGYYKLIYKCSLDTSISVSVVAPSDTGYFSHLSLPNLELNYGAVDGIRVLAASLMYTNEASPLYRQGKLAMLQSPQDRTWYSYAAGGFDSVSRALGSLTLPAENGMYGFLKPTKPEDFNFVDQLVINDGVIFDSKFPLKEETAYLVFSGSITTVQGLDGYYTLNYGVEYQTVDTWRDLGSSNITVDAAKMALEEVRVLNQFYENPLHLKDLWASIKKFARSGLENVVRYGPSALSLAGTAARLLA